MYRDRLLHSLLAAVGLAALAAYLVACRPSWSPDGARLVYPFSTPDKQHGGVAVYDLKRQTAESVFQFPKNTDASSCWCQWDSTGKQIIICAAGSSTLQVMLVNPPEKTPRWATTVPTDSITPGAPLAEIEGKLLLAGDRIARMDLNTGAVEQQRELDQGEELVLVSQGGRALYCMKREQKYEIGSLSPADLSLEARLTIPEHEAGQLFPLFDVDERGARLVFSTKKEQEPYLLIVEGNRLKPPVALKLPPGIQSCSLGNVQWSKDGQTVYAAVVAKGEGASTVQLAAGEIEIGSGKTRLTPLLALPPPTQEEEDLLPVFFQISLSPGGQTIAAATTVLDKVANESDRALLLADLTTPERRVTKVYPADGGEPGK